jgi:uncharacterized iron-regulated membrane protein
MTELIPQEGRSKREQAARAAHAPRRFGASAQFAVLGLALAASPAALAYVGPGAGLGLLGIVAAVLAAIVMSFFGLVMWPIRKIAQQRKAHAHERPRAANVDSERAQRDATKRPGPKRR